MMRRRVPVVQQMTPTECGPACLAMVLGFHGRRTRLAECRERCGAGRDGATALALARAGRSFGLRVRAFSAPTPDLSQVGTPAVAHWEGNHFVVVERWTPRSVDLVDPAIGRRRLTADEFAAGFSGVVMTFEPTPELEPPAPKGGFTWRAFLGSMLRTPGVRGPLIQIVGASLLLQALGLALPLFTKIVVDDVLPGRLGGILPALGLGMLAWIAAQSLTGYLRSLLVIWVQSRLDAQLMLGFFAHLLSLPFAFFQRRTSGDLLMRLSSNSVLREVLTSQTVSALFDSVLLVVTMSLMLAIAPVYGLIAAAIGIAQVALVAGTTPWMRRLTQSDLQAQSEAQSYVVEALGGIATLKASGAEERAVEHWTRLFLKQLRVSVRRSHGSALVETAMSGLRTAAPLALLLYGTMEVLGGSLSLGSMLGLNALAASFLSPLMSLVSMAQNLQVAGAHLDRITDVLGAEPEQDAAAAKPVERLRGRIEFRGVGFRYDPGAPLALKDVSLVIEPGQKVALVGRTGSGKSTLGKLLLGLYAPTEGEVRVDGEPIERWNLAQLRRRFGVVLQESYVFSGSIRRNIAWNDPELPLERVVEVARLAAIDEEIAAMPMGYETLLSEGGTGLSGGQRQRLSIARALAHRPSLLLLDEATSHLDVVTESQVDANLNAIECTRVVIAHRLSTIRHADVIFVLEAGEIVERGTHEELMAREGAYAALLRQQIEA